MSEEKNNRLPNRNDFSTRSCFSGMCVCRDLCAYSLYSYRLICLGHCQINENYGCRVFCSEPGPQNERVCVFLLNLLQRPRPGRGWTWLSHYLTPGCICLYSAHTRAVKTR